MQTNFPSVCFFITKYHRAAETGKGEETFLCKPQIYVVDLNSRRCLSLHHCIKHHVNVRSLYIHLEQEEGNVSISKLACRHKHINVLCT
jgi:hypothetical protein